MKMKEVVDGVKRILDAATEKFNAFCEEAGIEPDDERLTETPDTETEEGEEEIQSAEGGAVEGGEGTGDENTMPIPDEAAAQAAGIDAAAMGHGGAAEIPAEAQQMPVGDVNAGVEAPVAGAEGGAAALSPDEEELLRQQQEQAAAQQ